MIQKFHHIVVSRLFQNQEMLKNSCTLMCLLVLLNYFFLV